jgi:beta-1,4-mannosyltransferase
MAPASRATVLVLGDVGRSPRMQYHALSLADQAGMEVDLVGYAGARCHERIAGHPRIHLRLMRPWTFAPPKALFLLVAPFKVLFQLAQLFFTLLVAVPRPDFLLVQNPPAIPTLFVARLVAALRCSRLVIDWHNFGYTLLGMSLGARHPLVRVAYWYERVWGRGAAGNLCVTKAMAAHLRAEWGIEAQVLYDRPPDIFRRLQPAEIHELFVRLERDGALAGVSWRDERGEHSDQLTWVTERRDGSVSMRRDRPVVVVSSTSWSVDENFDTLLEAVEFVEGHAASKRFPRILVLITGKGPRLPHYKAKIAQMKLERCQVLTAWLAAEDYPRLLGAADLGISLHESSSKLDLPMKVVDMFGCQLPVCAVGYECLGELVQHGKNGLIFEDSSELAHQLVELLRDFPAAPQLDAFRKDLASFQRLRWSDNWERSAKPLFDAPHPARAARVRR